MVQWLTRRTTDQRIGVRVQRKVSINSKGFGSHLPCSGAAFRPASPSAQQSRTSALISALPGLPGRGAAEGEGAAGVAEAGTGTPEPRRSTDASPLLQAARRISDAETRGATTRPPAEAADDSRTRPARARTSELSSILLSRQPTQGSS